MTTSLIQNNQTTVPHEFQMDMSSYLKALCTGFDYYFHLFLLYFKCNSDTVHIPQKSLFVLLFLFCGTVNSLEAQTVSFIFLSCLFHQSLTHNGHSLLFNEHRKICTTTCKRNRFSELGKWINTIMTLQASEHTCTPFLPVSFPRLSGSPGPQPEEHGHGPPLSCFSVPSLTRTPTPSPILVIIWRSARPIFSQKFSLVAFTQENLLLLQIFVLIIIKPFHFIALLHSVFSTYMHNRVPERLKFWNTLLENSCFDEKYRNQEIESLKFTVINNIFYSNFNRCLCIAIKWEYHWANPI